MRQAWVLRKVWVPTLLIPAFALSGCGRQPTWIDAWHGAAHPVAYYTVGTATVPQKDIGPLYEVLSKNNHAYPITSNRMPDGTKVFAIQGQNPLRVLAVETGRGKFVKAVYAGTKMP